MRLGTYVAQASGRDRRLIQPTTVPPPAILTDTRARTAHVRTGLRRAPAKPRVRPIPVIVLLEIDELHLQISDRPEERAVETFASNRSNQPFDEWMRERDVRHRLDFLDVEYPQIRLPLLEPIQRIMVRTEVSRRSAAWPRVARLNILHNATPSTTPRCTPKPTMRRVHWSITTSTQCVRRTADSH